jgi:hypothetical protein
MTTITTIIETKYHTKSGEKFSPVEYIEHQVSIDGDLIYLRKSSPKKWFASEEPLRKFELWLLDKKPKCCCNVSGNSGNGINLVRHRWFQRFDFKQKFFNILRKKFFLRSKSAV